MGAGGYQAMRGDAITLNLPGDSDFRSVAMLVVGGLAARLDLTLETLEDLEIAIESLLDLARDGGGITLELRVQDGVISASVGPVDGGAVRGELAAEVAPVVDLRRVLTTVADRIEVTEREGTHWLSVEKRITTGERSVGG